MRYAKYLISAIDSALMAGKEILDVYDTDFDVENKKDDSPLTIADRRSHEIIKSDLSKFGLPFISEEGKQTPYEVRRDWSTIWIVDPLDGTKEFIKRNGEFTVNIALVENQKPVLGVVYAPVPESLYFASTEIGAHKLTLNKSDTVKLDVNDAEEYLGVLINTGSKLPVEQHRKTYTIVGSRSHGTPELEAFVKAKKEEKGDVEFIAAGSSLKICLVAEGAADIYPRLGPTMEWDTAAGQAVAECSGAGMYEFKSSQGLKYNKEDLLNPYFVVER